MPVAEHDALDGIEETLGKKVGPMPLGAWLLAVVGGLGVAWMIRRNGGGGGGQAAADGTSTDGTTAGFTNPGAGNLGAYPSDADGGGEAGATTTNKPTTNEEWYQRALDVLLATQWGYSPTFLSTALGKYLDGQALTVSEQAAVNTAIRAVGAPPVPPPLPTTNPVDPDPVVTPDPTPQTQPQPGNSHGTDTPAGGGTTVMHITKPPVHYSPGSPVKDPPRGPKIGPAAWQVDNKPKKPQQKVITHTVKKGETLASIAKHYGTSVDVIWRYNTTSGNRPADTIATIKKRGKVVGYVGSTWLIPVKG